VIEACGTTMIASATRPALAWPSHGGAVGDAASRVTAPVLAATMTLVTTLAARLWAAAAALAPVAVLDLWDTAV
jgi:hypothetical protein